MITCLYKKTFLKDLAKLPSDYREQVGSLVFEKIPKLNVTTQPAVILSVAKNLITLRAVSGEESPRPFASLRVT
ncbi:MAG: hypothetical protein AUK00_04130 [Dehalococcoidia bacterium CG2_30_46_9]|nr:MAG: hypothetical protein AUK00_04130 [Dehalococcoidia bacterium CG2_30_46_9]